MFYKRQIFKIITIVYVIAVISVCAIEKNEQKSLQLQMVRQSRLLKLHESTISGPAVLSSLANEATVTSPPISIHKSRGHRFRHPKGLLFPQPDRDGRCPPGYVNDRRSICREV